MFIPIIGQTSNVLTTVANRMGAYFHEMHLTPSDVVTVCAIMTVKAAKYAGFTREQVLNYVAARWVDQEPGVKPPGEPS